MNEERIMLITKDFVEEFGNKKQKEVYSRTRKLPKNTRNALINEAKTGWNEVVFTKNPNGLGNVFILSGKLNVKRDKMEVYNYQNCGQDQLPYKEDIREAILTYLSDTEEITITPRHLLRKLGILDEVLFVACRKFSAKEQKDYYNNLDEKYKVNGHAIFWDTVHIEYARLEENLESVLKDMAKSKIIKISNVTNVAYIGKREHETLHILEAKKIDDFKCELREKYDVTPNELLFKPKAKVKQIKGYKVEEKEFFESLGIEYVYDAIAIYINATKKEIDWYKARELSKTIKQKHLQHAYEKAVKRENKCKDMLLEQLGGRTKPLILIDNPTNQEWIKYKKLNSTYANEIHETLKTINNV